MTSQGGRTFLIAISIPDSDLVGFLAENIDKGRAIEKIGIIRELPTAMLEPPAAKRAIAARSREEAILDALKSGALTGRQLRDAYRKAGHAASGYWGVNYRLLKQGKMVKRGKRGSRMKTYERRAP